MCEVEHGVFTPLVLSTTGSLGCEATTFYKHVADIISWKQQKQYTNIICWLWCRLSFAILRSAIMCVRDSQSSYHRLRCEIDITLATAECLLTQWNHTLKHHQYTSFYCFSLFLFSLSYLNICTVAFEYHLHVALISAAGLTITGLDRTSKM